MTGPRDRVPAKCPPRRQPAVARQTRPTGATGRPLRHAVSGGHPSPGLDRERGPDRHPGDDADDTQDAYIGWHRSPQERWLVADLAAHPRLCTLACWHQPRFSPGVPGPSDRAYRAFWDDLYAYRADVVLNGHAHDYERFAPQTPMGEASPTGIREFVVGTGGAGQLSLGTVEPNSEVRHTGTQGVLRLTLRATSYDWRFLPVPGETFTDGGAGMCQ
jgi:hypothetical protein